MAGATDGSADYALSGTRPEPRALARILVVESDAPTLTILESLLTDEGYSHLTPIDDPDDVVPAIGRVAPELVLLDLNLPLRSGYEVLRDIRRSVAPADQPAILALTGDQGREARLKALNAGASDFLAKPFDRAELRIRVRNLVDGRLAQRFIREQQEMLQRMVDARTRELQESRASAIEAKEFAESANRSKSVFLASVSHELRTPLNAILGFSEMMSTEALGPLGNERYRQYIADIHGSGNHLLSIIDEILDVSAVESGSITLNKQTVRIEASIDEAVRYCTRAAENKRIALTVDGSDSVPSLEADPNRLRQIFVNLIGNAIKYTKSGGAVTIAVDAPAPGSVRVIVSDTGIGIPADKIDRVLQPFFRVGSSFTADEGGAGLGLTIVDSLVRLHGGSLSVDSTLEEGTRVTVVLPGTVPVDDE